MSSSSIPSIDPSPDPESVISMIRSSQSALSAVLLSSIAAGRAIADTNQGLLSRRKSITAISGLTGKLHSHAMATKSLHARINRAVSPAFSILPSFSLAERLSRSATAFNRSDHIAEYVDCIHRLSDAVASLTSECEPAIQRLQEGVEFVRRTKAADLVSVRRLKEGVVALRAVREEEFGAIGLFGSLDDAIVRLPNEYKKLLRRLGHADVGGKEGDDRLAGGMDGPEWPVLGSEKERAVLRLVTEILASKNMIDMCIDIFVKVRHHHAIKACGRLIMDYGNKYTLQEIDRMDWESLNSAISLWISYLRLAITFVLPAEKHLCHAALSVALDEAIWPRCFAKISHGIMLVLFRFGEGVALSSNDPHKLITLLKMTETVRCLRPSFSALFDDSAPKLSARARDLEKLLVGSSFRAFSALDLSIDGAHSNFLPHSDASVPSVVVYGVNYLKCLAADECAMVMAHVLSSDEALKDSLNNVLDTMQRSVKAIWGDFKDRVVAHVFAMNTNWYMYTRTRGTKLAFIVGEEEIRNRYKGAAEAAAYAYQADAWEPLVVMLEKRQVEDFMSGMDHNLRRHRVGYQIQDADLREQIKEAVVKMILPAYEEFLNGCSMPQGNDYVPVEDIMAMFVWIFGGGREEEKAREKKMAANEMLKKEDVALPQWEKIQGRRWRRRRRRTGLQFRKSGKMLSNESYSE